MNRTKLRWTVYNDLRKKNVIYARRGGYSVKHLCEFILSLRKYPLPFSSCDEELDCEQTLIRYLNSYSELSTFEIFHKQEELEVDG